MEDNKTQNITDLTPKTISGIDTLYYFYESNELYDDFFLDVLDQLEEYKARFDKREINYEYSDLKIAINNQTFEYNGKSTGFYWFTQLDGFITIGFKDTLTNRGLNDIQVQFNAVGIYTLGLKALLKYCDALLSEVTTGYKPITRVDLNIFAQADLSWLNKDMFVSRKRSYRTHLKEVCSKYRLQTLYVGKEPFLLRLYDKKEELKNSKKKELMYEYFLNNNFTREDDIFNIEFELHRKHLKSFAIDTVDDLLSRAEAIFKDSIEAIRLVDLSTISENSANSKNRYKADIHPLWQHLSDSYKLADFLALDMPLERIKRKTYSYTIEDSIKEQVALVRKAYIHNIIIDTQYFEEVLNSFEREYKQNDYAVSAYSSNDNTATNKQNIEIIYKSIDSNIDVKGLTDIELEKYLKLIEADMTNTELPVHILINKHQNATLELKHRGKLAKQEEFPF